MAKSKPDTLRDPVREVFGERPLLSLDARTLRAGIEKLKALQAEASEQIAAIRKGTVDNIIAGKPGAVDTMLQPDAEMEQAQRWKLAIATAQEAAELAEEQVDRREKDAPLAVRRQKVVAALSEHEQAADRLEAAVDAVAAAFADLDRCGLQALRIAGVRLQGGAGPLFRADHTRHMIELQLYFRSEGLWGYERVPPMLGNFRVSREAVNIGADLLRQFEETLERQTGRPIDWETVPEAAGAGA